MVPGALGGLRMVDGIQVNQAKLSLPTGPNQPVTMLGDMWDIQFCLGAAALGSGGPALAQTIAVEGVRPGDIVNNLTWSAPLPDGVQATAMAGMNSVTIRLGAIRPAMVPVLFRFVFRAPLIARHTP
jgi:hypothetical protein